METQSQFPQEEKIPETQLPESGNNNGKKNKNLKILAIILSVVVAAGIGFIFFWGISQRGGTPSELPVDKPDEVINKPPAMPAKPPVEEVAEDTGETELAIPPRIILATQAPYADYSRLSDFIRAGINHIDLPLIEVKNLDERQRIRREYVNQMNQYDIPYTHLLNRTGEQIEDENFGKGGWIDEPFLFFPEHANISETERQRIASGQDIVTASRAFETYMREKIISFDDGGERDVPGSADIVESIAWYHLKAGSGRYWAESTGVQYLEQIHFFNDYFNLGIPETFDNYIRLLAAFVRGSSNYFGKPWGVFVYQGTIPTYRARISRELYDRGATSFYFWGPPPVGDGLSVEEIITLANDIGGYASTRQPTKNQARIAILIPANYIVPSGGYYSEELCSVQGVDCKNTRGEITVDPLWRMFQLQKSQTQTNVHLITLRKIGEAIKEALATGEEFDILVNDETLRPDYLERYERVERVE